MPAKPLSISIVIPVLNEERHLGTLLHYIQQSSSPDLVREIICVDGGSSDHTVDIIKKHGAMAVQSEKGRAKQMNLGAEQAQGDVLYFLHADTFPPKGFDQVILNAIKNGHETGCFRMKFDTRNPLLQFFAWFSRINHILCRGGDQSLFIKSSLFKETGGFNETYTIYEDTEFIQRLYRHTRFKVLPYSVLTSARKYDEVGWLRLQFHFAMIHLKNFTGAGPEKLHRYYTKNITAKAHSSISKSA
jgi:rSAM/selenodomain-associated transferase 2